MTLNAIGVQQTKQVIGLENWKRLQGKKWDFIHCVFWELKHIR